MNVINLKINGKDIQCQMGILAIRKYCDHYNIPLEELGASLQKAGVFAVTDMVFFAHQAYCDLNGKSTIVNRDECTTAVEYLNEEAINLIMASIMDIKILGKSISEAEEGAKKKGTTISR